MPALPRRHRRATRSRMKPEPTSLPDVIRLTPRRITDARGYFLETFRLNTFQKETGTKVDFKQENQSLSLKANTVRGLHFQGPPKGQGKLVRCLQGSILDVAVDIRRGSPTYGQSVVEELSCKNDQQLWIPAGFLHGFRTLEDNTIVSYRCTAIYHPESEGAVIWNDPDLNIAWGIETPQAISERDLNAAYFADFKSPFRYKASS